MPPLITKKTIEYLSQLARIELTPEEEKKLQKDLDKILAYFRELQEVPTEEATLFLKNTSSLKNNFRKDEKTNNFEEKGTNQFPQKEDGFLKIPAVFED